MQADALSRFSKDQVSDKEDNCQVQVLKPEHFIRAAKAHFVPEVDSLGDRIRWASLREAEVIEGLKSIDKSAPKALTNGTAIVTDLQGPPSERTPEEKLWDFKTRAQQYARDRGSCDDTWISYLEFLESEVEDDLTLAWMIAG
jgi:hypothetical protein